eukprot:5639826-Pyramimonas_sp.AAC.1
MIEDPGEDPIEDAGLAGTTKYERLQREAVSRQQLLTHAEEPFLFDVPAGNDVEAATAAEKNNIHKQIRPYSELKKFGGLSTMDHWFAADELSRGLYGETSCATLRDGCT